MRKVTIEELITIFVLVVLNSAVIYIICSKLKGRAALEVGICGFIICFFIICIAKGMCQLFSNNSYEEGDEMNNRAKFLDASDKQKDKIEVIRSSFSKMYDVIEVNCKDSRETSLAITKLEEAQFWAIRRNK